MITEIKNFMSAAKLDINYVMLFFCKCLVLLISLIYTILDFIYFIGHEVWKNIFRICWYSISRKISYLIENIFSIN